MINLPANLPLIILTISALVSAVLYLREYNARKKLEGQSEKVLEEFREKGLEGLHQSIQKSQDIISQAEVEGVKVVADTRFHTSKMEKGYEDKLGEIINNSQAAINNAQAQLIQFMADLQKKSLDFELASQKSTQDRISQMFERLEQRLSDFLVTTSQKTTSSIELEVKASRELIESYKEQQLKLIDENILAMMEQTLSIVLGKKLSLKEQLDLIYEALEKAKVEKFIV